MALQSVVLKPGECVVLPAGATISSLILDGSISVTSSCNDLPDPSGYVCGLFYVIVDEDDNDGHSMDERHTYIDYVQVGNTQYPMGIKFITSGDGGSSVTVTTAELNAFIPSNEQPIFKFTNVTRDGGPDKRQPLFLYFRVPETLLDSVVMKVSNYNSVQYYKNFATVDCGSYPYPG